MNDIVISATKIREWTQEKMKLEEEIQKLQEKLELLDKRLQTVALFVENINEGVPIEVGPLLKRFYIVQQHADGHNSLSVPFHGRHRGRENVPHQSALAQTVRCQLFLSTLDHQH